jgi:hypothetical protein
MLKLVLSHSSTVLTSTAYQNNIIVLAFATGAGDPSINPLHHHSLNYVFVVTSNCLVRRRNPPALTLLTTYLCCTTYTTTTSSNIIVVANSGGGI